MFLQGCFQALNLSTQRSIIGRLTAQHMIRTVVLIDLGAIRLSRISLSRISCQGVVGDRSDVSVIASSRPKLPVDTTLSYLTT
jgi:hypothetical protein